MNITKKKQKPFFFLYFKIVFILLFVVVIKVGTGGMDSKVNAATWALDRGVSVVICNGTQDKAIKTIIAGRKVGTFFTETSAGGPTPVETLAENG